MKKVIQFVLVLSFGSCSFNSMFFHPYELKESSTFKEFDEDKNDTLQLKFDKNKNPVFGYISNNEYESNYEIEGFFIEKSNGDSINAWMITPKGDRNGTTIYCLHGNAGNLVYQYRLMTPFVEKGFTVFMIDYSEFGFSQGEATRKNVLTDAYAGFDYILSLKPEKLILYGQSLGGHLAAAIANKYEDQIDALVIEGAFSSHKDIAARDFKFLGRIFVKEGYSAKDSIPLFSKPVLVIHSTEDETIPYKHGVKLYEKASEPKKLYTIEKPHVRGPLYYADSIAFKMVQMIITPNN